jgi:Predicted permeases
VTIDITVVASVVATMFFVVIIGYIARKTNILNESASKIMSDLVIKVGQPFMIISAVLGIPYSNENLLEGGYILLLSLIIHIIAAGLAFITTAKFKDQEERRLTEFAATYANCGFMGFPLISAIFGNIGLFWASFFVIVFNLICWTYGQYVLSRANSNVKINPFNIFINYGTVPCVLGLVLYVLRVGDLLPNVAFDAMDYLGSLCTPLAMLVVGGLLATIPVKKLLTNVKIYLLCAVKLLILPIISGIILILLGFSNQMALFGSVMAALPTAANTAIFGESYNIKPSYAAHTVGMTTLLSVVTIPSALFIVSKLIDMIG